MASPVASPSLARHQGPLSCCFRLPLGNDVSASRRPKYHGLVTNPDASRQRSHAVGSPALRCRLLFFSHATDSTFETELSSNSLPIWLSEKNRREPHAVRPKKQKMLGSSFQEATPSKNRRNRSRNIVLRLDFGGRLTIFDPISGHVARFTALNLLMSGRAKNVGARTAVAGNTRNGASLR